MSTYMQVYTEKKLNKKWFCLNSRSLFDGLGLQDSYKNLETVLPTYMQPILPSTIYQYLTDSTNERPSNYYDAKVKEELEETGTPDNYIDKFSETVKKIYQNLSYYVCGDKKGIVAFDLPVSVIVQTYKKLREKGQLSTDQGDLVTRILENILIKHEYQIVYGFWQPIEDQLKTLKPDEVSDLRLVFIFDICYWH
ncbi:hypothetical protein [Lactobacillus crispatus]|uniref:hypothetical protein n=1 Tax=Lactobacillus crispatus TaxID=47770 RepID=UPI0022CDC347|nr:hypothetical protein [Lactobacillus crispatus]MCZ9663364.1 hypothetical protein [Lactobacillus crispatus]